MAQWKETLEPYVKVTERVKTAVLTPTAGEDLIIGSVIISDAGPSVPTLIRNQAEFLSTFASGELGKSYLNSLNNLYTGTDKTLAATMWANAYRLAGSNSLLVCRASKGTDMVFAKSLVSGDNADYVLRNGELLKKCPKFKICINTNADGGVTTTDNGWAIAVNGIGVIGTYTTDAGPQYDYQASNLPELVDMLNESGRFFSPSYKFYSEFTTNTGNEVTGDLAKSSAKCVVFEEVYLGSKFLDVNNSKTSEGLTYMVTAEPDWTESNQAQKQVKLNSALFSGFDEPGAFATNIFNTSTTLKVRIRKFNHDAVVFKKVEPSVDSAGVSGWTVLGKVLKTFTTTTSEASKEAIKERDFFEIAILDPSVSDTPVIFNVGNIPGRGDVSVEEVNENLSMIGLHLPEDLHDLNLNYYGYAEDNQEFIEVENPGSSVSVTSVESLPTQGAGVGTYYKVNKTGKFYKYMATPDTLYTEIGIDPTKSSLLDVSDSDLKKALDLLVLDEVHTVEGLSDLGNTDPSFQSYMANVAIGSNYFYPITTIPSTNYMSIAQTANLVSQESNKLYMAAPWDLDGGTFGFTVPISPSVIFWEAVARNRRNNNEFASVFGQNNGVVQYQKPMTEFNKKTRQLLLTKKINTVIWNTQTSAWNFNDSNTKESVGTIMSTDGNSRLAIRIAKAIPTLLRQFIGSKVGPRLWEDARSVIDLFFRTTIIPLGYSINDYNIVIDETNNPESVQRANKMKVLVEIRYDRDLKYIEVYNNHFDVGMEFTGAE